MPLRFDSFGDRPAGLTTVFQGKLVVQKSVRWTRRGFQLVCQEARAKGMEPAAYIRNAAVKQAARDATDRRRKIVPFLGDGGE